MNENENRLDGQFFYYESSGRRRLRERVSASCNLLHAQSAFMRRGARASGHGCF